MSVLLVVGLAVVAGSVETDVVRSVLVYLLVFQAVTAVVTLVPMEYPSWWGKYAGRTSDERKALDCCAGSGAGTRSRIRRRRSPVLAV